MSRVADFLTCDNCDMLLDEEYENESLIIETLQDENLMYKCPICGALNYLHDKRS